MAVAVKGTAQAASGATVTIPTHAVGDLIVVYAHRDGSTTIPTKPTASGTVPAWVTIDGPTGANLNSLICAYFVATATNHTSGTWTNATGMAAIVITGQSPTVLGGHAQGGSATTNSAVAPTITLTQADGSSLLLEFWGSQTVTAWGSPPAGVTDQATVLSTGQVALATKDVSTSTGAQTRTITAPATNGYRGEQIEIVSGPQPTDTVTTAESLGATGRPILYDPIDTTETVNVVISGGVATLTINVSDAASTAETTAVQESTQVNVSDAASTADTVTVSLVAAGTRTVNVSDSTSTADTVAAKLSDAAVNVSDSVSTTNVPALQCPSPLNVTDSAHATESLTVSPPSSIPTISVSDSTTTSEWIVIAFDPDTIFTLEVNVSDAATTSETTSAQCPSPLNVSDAAHATETTAASISSPQVNVSDSAHATETTTATTADLKVAPTDSTSTSESVTVVLPLAGSLTIVVQDSAHATETTNATVSTSRIAVSDSTSTGESVAVIRNAPGQPPNTHPPLGGTFDTTTSGGTFNGGASGGNITTTSRGGNVTFLPLGGTPNTGSSGGTIKKPTRGGIVQLPAAGGDIE